MGLSRRQFTKEFKLAAVRRLENGVSIAEVAPGRRSMPTIAYDRMASLLAPYENKHALSVARDLDAKVEDVLRQAAA